MKRLTEEELHARRSGGRALISTGALCGFVVLLVWLLRTWPKGTNAPDWANAIGLTDVLIGLGSLVAAAGFTAEWRKARRRALMTRLIVAEAAARKARRAVTQP